MSGRFPRRFGDDVVVEDVDLDEEVVVVGERLTNERAERMAQEALAQLNRPGRRSLSGEGSHFPGGSVPRAAVMREAVEARAGGGRAGFGDGAPGVATVLGVAG